MWRHRNSHRIFIWFTGNRYATRTSFVSGRSEIEKKIMFCLAANSRNWFQREWHNCFYVGIMNDADYVINKIKLNYICISYDLFLYPNSLLWQHVCLRKDIFSWGLTVISRWNTASRPFTEARQRSLFSGHPFLYKKINQSLLFFQRQAISKRSIDKESI